ncbi:MAG: GH32 C-terminal domain-containing protein, partial [Ginsengibacter sp.]
DYGDCFYAAIPWNNLPLGKKIFIGWMVPRKQETYPWKGQMSIARDLSLRTTTSGIRLYQEPTALIKNNLAKLSGQDPIELKNIEVDGPENNFLQGKEIHGNSYWLEADLVVAPNANAGFNIACKKGQDNKIINGATIGYDAAKHELYIDRANPGNSKIEGDKARLTAIVNEINGKIKLEILLDKSSLEVFVNDGEKVFTTYIFPDETADVLSAFSTAGKSLITSLEIWNLSKIKQ